LNTLPAYSPIDVFVHHNTLHAFEHLPFEKAVIEAAQLFGAKPYTSEAAYWSELTGGRVQLVDVDAVLDQEHDSLIFACVSRGSLQSQSIDSTMHPRKSQLFDCTWSRPSQRRVPAGLTPASDFSLCFKCKVASRLMLRRLIETTAFIGHFYAITSTVTQLRSCRVAP
jgi:Na+-translocating membrane potential-generating system (MpsB)